MNLLKSPAQIMRDGILSCGHPAEREDDKIIIDQCFECDWETEERRLSNVLNDAAADRGAAEIELVTWCREHGENGYDKDMMAELFERTVRVNLRFGREEAIRAKLKELHDEDD